MNVSEIIKKFDELKRKGYGVLNDDEKKMYHRFASKLTREKNIIEYRFKNSLLNRLWRRKNPDYFKKYMNLPSRVHQRNVRNLTNRLIARGVIRRGDCEVCGLPNAEAHHEDYNEPMRITWLCRLHHKHEHMKNG